MGVGMGMGVGVGAGVGLGVVWVGWGFVSACASEGARGVRHTSAASMRSESSRLRSAADPS